MKLSILLLAAAVLTPIAAFAQTVDVQPIPDLPLRTVPPAGKSSPAGSWTFSIGGGISYAPRYEGAASNRLRFMPLLEASYSNGKLFMSPLRGIGYNFSDDRNLQYGVRLTIDRGRKQNVDPHLNGMGDIGYAPAIGVFFNRRFAPWYVSGSLATSTHGTYAAVGTGMNFQLSISDRMRIGANLNWADTKYNQTFFGVTPVQAAASGNVLTAYDAAAGIKDYALTANWMHIYSRQWFSSLGASIKQLEGSARDSPLTMRRTTSSFNFLVGYRF
jgi:MipA family protein